MMAGWTLKPGAVMRVEWGGRVYGLVLEDITLAGPLEIRWQQAGKPPRLKSVTLVLRDQTPEELEDAAFTRAAVTAAEPELPSDVLDEVIGAVAELELDYGEQPDGA